MRPTAHHSAQGLEPKGQDLGSPDAPFHPRELQRIPARQVRHVIRDRPTTLRHWRVCGPRTGAAKLTRQGGEGVVDGHQQLVIAKGNIQEPIA
jgi:hypothetical protein